MSLDEGKTQPSLWPRVRRLVLIVVPLGLAGLGLWLWRTRPSAPLPRIFGRPTSIVLSPGATQAAGGTGAIALLPAFDPSGAATPVGVGRLIDLHTERPERVPDHVVTYTVDQGDSVFSIAKQFSLKPETILWGNIDVLEDNPELLKPGQVLNILPVNGVYYRWQQGDTLQAVASEFHVTADDILGFPGNDLNPLDPQVQAGDYIIVPGGRRPLKDWAAPVRIGNSVSFPYLGPGACPAGYTGPVGAGQWVFPAVEHYISGNDFWSGHPGVDIAGGFGYGAFAADSGVVVFAGWSTKGYGNLVILDHRNGWITYYGHLNQVNVSCGQPVYGGQLIGLIGSTGNSTGPHLHFEMRYNGTPENPHGYLPW